jgi:ABC-type transport system substrate-binding protein
MARLRGEHNSPDAYLGRYEIPVFKGSADTAAELYREIEEILLQNAFFIPVCFQTEMFFYNQRVSDLVYNPFTSAIIFREGKYF